MLTALALVTGLLLAQAQPALAPAGTDKPIRATLSLPHAALDEGQEQGAASLQEAAGEEADSSAETSPPGPCAEPKKDTSIFSRPCFADSSGIAWIIGTRPGRFNIIDWQARPNRDRL